MSEKQNTPKPRGELIKQLAAFGASVALSAFPAVAKASETATERTLNPTRVEKVLNGETQRDVARMVTRIEHLASATKAVHSITDTTTTTFIKEAPVKDSHKRGRYVFQSVAATDAQGRGHTQFLSLKEVAGKAPYSPTYVDLTFSQNPLNKSWEIGGVYHKSNTSGGPEVFLHGGVAPVAANALRINQAELKAFVTQANLVIGRAAHDQPIEHLPPAFHQHP